MKLIMDLKKLKHRNAVRAALIILLTLLVQPSQLFALSFGGVGVNSAGEPIEIVQIAPPPDASWEALESSTDVHFWAEQSGVVLSSPLSVDVINPSGNPEADIAGPDWWTYDSGVATTEAKWNGDLQPGVYDSYILHADKQGTNETFAGWIEFDNPIVAIIYKRPELIATDPIFGAPGTIYDESSTRLYELDGAANWFRVSADGLTLEFQTYVPHDLDNMRIITASSSTPVPEPATMLLFGTGLAGLASVARRRK